MLASEEGIIIGGYVNTWYMHKAKRGLMQTKEEGLTQAMGNRYSSRRCQSRAGYGIIVYLHPKRPTRPEAVACIN